VKCHECENNTLGKAPDLSEKAQVKVNEKTPKPAKSSGAKMTSKKGNKGSK